MKYVASMKLDRDMSTTEINRLRVSLDEYMKEHPAIDDDSFRTMQSLALKLHNEKLIEKCAMANSRCLETDKLLRARRSTLRKAEQHIALEETPKTLNNNNKFCVVSPLQNGDSQSLSHMMIRNGNYGDPPSVVIRRRSYAGKAASPVYSPTADAYKECVKDMRLKEQLFRDSVITVDMLCNVVTSLPKNLSDSTLRGSRESLRGSCENLALALAETASNERKGMSLPSNATRTVDSSCGTSAALTHSASDESIRRRGGTRDERRINRRSARTFSMMTGSCESLPG